MAVTNVDPGTLAASWAQRMGASGDRMKAGAAAVTTAPGQAAAAAKDAYLAGVNANVGIWQQKVAAVSKADWEAAFVNKGIPRVAAGAQAAQPKMVSALTKILAAEKSIVPGLPARGGLEANIARSAEFQRQMAARKGQLGA